MDDKKYIGLGIHQATISGAVLDASGELVMDCVTATQAATILEFPGGPRGSL